MSRMLKLRRNGEKNNITVAPAERSISGTGNNTNTLTTGGSGISCSSSTSLRISDIEDCCPPAAVFDYARHDESFHEFSAEHGDVLRTSLVDWYNCNRRKLPWRGDAPPWLGSDDCGKGATTIEPSPYGTWVSEVMLQQTQVATVVAFYERWMHRFPTIQTLADVGMANQEDVKLLWSGLGYYSRARLLQEGARKVQTAYGGSVPSDIDKLKDLPGIGPYTAGAICSIAFGKPVAAVDGNVLRLCCISASTKHTPFIKHCWHLVDEMVKHCKDPSAFNQGLMELGATVCIPRNPKCSYCPVRAVCCAYHLANSISIGATTPAAKVEAMDEPIARGRCGICQKGDRGEFHVPASVGDLPLKAKKTRIREEVFALPIIRDSMERWLLVQRPETGLLAGQWELPCVLLSQGGDDGSRAVIPSSAICQQKVKDLLKEIAVSDDSSELLVNWPEASRIVHLFSHRRHMLLFAHAASVSSSSHLTFHRSSIEEEDCHGSTKKKSASTYRWMTSKDMTQSTVCLSSKKVMNYISSSCCSTTNLDKSCKEPPQLANVKNDHALEDKDAKEATTTSVKCHGKQQQHRKSTRRRTKSEGGGKSQLKKAKSRV